MTSQKTDETRETVMADGGNSPRSSDDKSNESKKIDRGKDVYHARYDGNELKIYNWANIQSHYQIRPGESEKTEVFVNAGNSSWKPEAVTAWLAIELKTRHGIDITDHGIEVVDLTNPEVTVL